MCALAVLLLLLGQTGCGDNLSLVPVTGSVIYQDSPVPGASVVFQPEEGPVAMATTDQEGRFELTTQGKRGIVAGTSHVAITALEPMENESGSGSPDAELDDADPAAWESSMTAADLEAMARRKSLIPEKYSHVRTSGLTVEPKAGEENDFVFELTD
ncbi:MAG: carboxypeptidase-like regulatory domain-containing protein [bacterium]